MKAKLPWILLAVSFAFNAFFAIGFLHAGGEMKRKKTFRARAEFVAKKLDLDDQQRKLFEDSLDKIEQLSRDRRSGLDAFLAELIKDEPDTKRLEDYVAGDSAKKYRLAKLAVMRKFIGILRPQQRQLLVELIKKRRSPRK